MGNLRWPSVTYRIFAVANLIFVTAGLFFLLPDAWTVYNGAIANTTESPYFIWAFWIMVFANTFLLGLLALGGIFLWRLREVGVSICNFTFIAEVTFFFAIGLMWGSPMPREISMSIAGATGVGNMGISPQILSGYPLFGLLFLNWARRAQRKNDSLVAASREGGRNSVPDQRAGDSSE